MRSFRIGEIVIGNDCDPLVIPEIGINHGGDLNVAKLMVDAAKRAGARIVKHQTHVVEDEMSHLAKAVIPGNSNKSIYQIMSECALTEEDEFELKEYVESKGMVYLSTPFSRAAADRLEKFGVLAYKIGSGEMNNYPLLEHIASFGKPMIVSTGMNDIDSIRKAVSIMEKHGVSYALLHTTNLYPTPPELVRLGAMQEIMKCFPDTPVGLSDHTVNNNSCLAATALGACILERHFTDVKTRNGPDIVCSMDEKGLSDLIRLSSEIKKMLGGTKVPAKEEKVTSDFAFSTVVTIKQIKKGDIFSEDNIWVKRPGIGEIPAADYSLILGKVALVDIEPDTQLKYCMVGK